ncbi:hypothetical protein [Agrobacterium sp. P15N1-A]|uniref:hypothetical protein n=1 Tax=Agrobacterium sp. P15N1-A TaxID=3342820 RepID=UPI0037D83D04
MKSRRREIPGNTVSTIAFTPASLASDTSWLPDVGVYEEPPASTETFVQAYLADPNAWHWSTDLLDGSRDDILRRALAIIAQARLPDHEQALGQLGAEPLEDIMSETLLDDLRAWMPFSEEMCYALKCVRMNVEPPVVQERLKEMLSESHRTRA